MYDVYCVDEWCLPSRKNFAVLKQFGTCNNKHTLTLTISGLFVLPPQSRSSEWMEGDDFSTDAVMNICGECDIFWFHSKSSCCYTSWALVAPVRGFTQMGVSILYILINFLKLNISLMPPIRIIQYLFDWPSLYWQLRNGPFHCFLLQKLFS